MKADKIPYTSSIKKSTHPVKLDEMARETLEVVSGIMEIPQDKIMGRCRKRELIYARILFCQRLREYGLTITTIGKFINRNHSQVIYYLRLYDLEKERSKYFNDLIKQMP